MITVELTRDERGDIVAYRVEGHSGWAARGSDIVCAGVAALTQAAALGLDRHVGVPLETEARDGYLMCRLLPGAPEGAAKEAQAVLATMVIGLREIAAAYPDYVTVVERGRKRSGNEKGGTR